MTPNTSLERTVNPHAWARRTRGHHFARSARLHPHRAAAAQLNRYMVGGDARRNFPQKQ